MPEALCRHHDRPKGHPFHGPACPDSPDPIDKRITIAIADPGAVTPRFFSPDDDDNYESVSRWSARAVQTVIDSLARHDPLTLLGKPDETRTEFWVGWHAGVPYADPHPGIRLSANRIPWIREAIDRGNRGIGPYGITWYTVERREHHSWNNGLELSTPWRRLQLPELFVKER